MYWTEFNIVTIDELIEVVQSAGVIKISATDPIPAYLLNKIKSVLLPYEFDIINKSLLEGTMEGLKHSIITPILKKAWADVNILKNFRPIFNL